ncbi:sigma-70 family RNA polymerase sigma factor [Streptomyces sp. NPDC006879]|uniref:sigma-70 family RNA polymerase sigma factor n=1 Tax=Streptomyces sp. NPDC006879 TaxID=3364767 RepID=UPI0036BB5DFC
MHTDSEHSRQLVSAARAGDHRARELLVADYLPLLYNIVGRALDGHADVDDVVQDTMLRALDGLAGLREPSRFRSWLVAIAMNQIRRRWTDQRRTASNPLERLAQHPDPAGDFVDLTILRLGLSGQRREVAEATRWLDRDDRALLSLWWQEASGQLTREELAEALGVPGRHAAVRIQRMKAQLETGRVVVRALAARPACPELAAITTHWDSHPSPIWRKRIARHARGCGRCDGHWSGLIPAEGLLAGLALVVPLSGYAPIPGVVGTQAVSTVSATLQAPLMPAVPTPGRGTAAGRGGAHAAPAGARWKAPAAVSGAVAGVVVLTVLWWPGSSAPQPAPGRKDAPLAAPSAPRAPSASPSPSASPTPPPSPAVSPRGADPTPPPRSERPTPSTARQVADLVNARRATAGCTAIRLDDRLTAAARAHARDMVTRGYFDHESPEGQHANARIAAAGYNAGPWAENLHRGPRDAATVVEDWMDGAIHQENMLDCRYQNMGVAAVPGPQGTVWVQTFAAPA